MALMVRGRAGLSPAERMTIRSARLADMDERPAPPVRKGERSGVHRAILFGYRWRWWIGLTALVAFTAVVVLAHQVWAVITAIAGIALLVVWFRYAASWVRAIDRSREKFREGLNGD